jgi:hypothetical protein
LKKKISLIFYYFLLVINFQNCLGYDFHPNILRGTKFYYNDINENYNQKIIVTPISQDIGKKLIAYEEPIFEYYLFSFYLGKLIGNYNNGNIFNKEELNKIDYILKNDEYLLVEISNINYESAAIMDFFLDYIPGGFFRIRKYTKKTILKILTNEEMERCIKNR